MCISRIFARRTTRKLSSYRPYFKAHLSKRLFLSIARWPALYQHDKSNCPPCWCVGRTRLSIDVASRYNLGSLFSHIYPTLNLFFFYVGNVLGQIGVSGGIAATLGLMMPNMDTLTQMAACMGVGGALGTVIAKKIEITDLAPVGCRFPLFGRCRRRC